MTSASLLLAVAISGQLFGGRSACGPGGCPAPSSFAASYSNQAPATAVYTVQPTPQTIDQRPLQRLRAKLDGKVIEVDGWVTEEGKIAFDHKAQRSGWWVPVSDPTEQPKTMEKPPAIVSQPKSDAAPPPPFVPTIEDPSVELTGSSIPQPLASGIQIEKVKRDRLGYTSNDHTFNPVNHDLPKPDPAPAPVQAAACDWAWVAFLAIVAGFFFFASLIILVKTQRARPR